MIQVSMHCSTESMVCWAMPSIGVRSVAWSNSERQEIQNAHHNAATLGGPPVRCRSNGAYIGRGGFALFQRMLVAIICTYIYTRYRELMDGLLPKGNAAGMRTKSLPSPTVCSLVRITIEKVKLLTGTVLSSIERY